MADRRSHHTPNRSLRISFILAAFGWFAMAASVAGAGPQVVVLPTTGIVDETMAGYLAEGIARAEDDGAAAVVVKLNTPGGSLFATQKITRSFLEAKVPVIVWVAPAGGFAASAGTFITLSGNLALMAPGTSIGAASPVGGQGEDITGTEGQKVMEIAIAMITSIADARDRPVDWAISTVKDAKAYTATQAIEAGAVDGAAATIDDVLAFANGRTIEVAGGEVTLDLDGATASELEMNPFQSLIRLLSDPSIAFLLFSIGSAGLLAELWSPNFVTGILGALAIILAFIGLGTLPLNVGGVILIIFGMILFGLELTVTSHGLLGVGGIFCVALGASALFTVPGDPFEPLVRVATPVIATVVVTFASLLALIVVAAVRTRHLLGGSATGAPLILGAVGSVRRPLDPIGSIFAAGEEWTARGPAGFSLDRGAAVRVVSMDGLTAVVEPDPSSSDPT